MMGLNVLVGVDEEGEVEMESEGADGDTVEGGLETEAGVAETDE